MLAFTTRGTGSQDVILLHGFLGSGRNLGSLARTWSARDKKVRLILPDLTGHGASPPLPPNADLRTLAHDVLDLAEAVGVAAPYRIVGHSLGGRVALRARLIDDTRIEEIVLLDITPGHVDHRVSGIDEVVAALLAAPDEGRTRQEIGDALIAAGLSHALAEWLLMNVVEEGDRYRWRIDRAALAALKSRVSRDELWTAVEEPGARIGLVRAADSVVVPKEDVDRFARTGRPIVIVEEAGHFLHQDQPERVLDAILGLFDA